MRNLEKLFRTMSRMCVYSSARTCARQRSEVSYVRCTRADWREKWRPSLTGDDTPRPTDHKRADASALLLLLRRVPSSCCLRARASARVCVFCVSVCVRVSTCFYGRACHRQKRCPTDRWTTIARRLPPPTLTVALLSGPRIYGYHEIIIIVVLIFHVSASTIIYQKRPYGGQIL